MFKKRYTSKEFLEKVEQKPLTPKRIIRTLNNKIAEISFDSKPLYEFITQKGKNQYAIFISSSKSQESQKDDLIHRIAHVAYEISIFGGLKDVSKHSTELKIIEDTIDKEAERFYQSNPDFVERLYHDITQRIYHGRVNYHGHVKP
jgi:hypothetical protein